MKKFLFLLLLLPITTLAQGVNLRFEVPAADGNVVFVTGAFDTGDGPFGIYKYSASSTKTDDSIWVFKVTDGTIPGRWEYQYTPTIHGSVKPITTATYTILPSDFNKTLVLTFNGARTITMPTITTVNAPMPVSIQDGTNNALANPITIQASETINDAASVVINSNGGELAIYKNYNSTKYLAK